MKYNVTLLLNVLIIAAPAMAAQPDQTTGLWSTLTGAAKKAALEYLAPTVQTQAAPKAAVPTTTVLQTPTVPTQVVPTTAPIVSAPTPSTGYFRSSGVVKTLSGALESAVNLGKALSTTLTGNTPTAYAGLKSLFFSLTSIDSLASIGVGYGYYRYVAPSSADSSKTYSYLPEIIRNKIISEPSYKKIEDSFIFGVLPYAIFSQFAHSASTATCNSIPAAGLFGGVAALGAAYAFKKLYQKDTDNLKTILYKNHIISPMIFAAGAFLGATIAS